MWKLSGFLLVLSAAFCLAAPVQADTVVPNGNAGVEGNLANNFPFSNVASERYQQVYDAGEFAGEGGPFQILEIRFRPDAVFGVPIPPTLFTVDIRLSTTSAAVDGLSTTFADNIGPDEIVVFSGGLTLSTANLGPAGGPKDFDIIIPLMTPFDYDPAAGNLLLDVRKFNFPISFSSDAEITTGDGTSRVFTGFLGNVFSLTGTADTLGLVTLFLTDAEPVPEPASLLLLGVGFGGVIALRRRRKPSA